MDSGGKRIMSLFTSQSTLKIPPDELRAQAEKTRACADEFAEALDFLTNLHATLLDGAWQGLAFDELVKVNAMNAEHYGKYVDRLYAMADFLCDVADKMQETDAANRTKLQSVG